MSQTIEIKNSLLLLFDFSVSACLEVWACSRRLENSSSDWSDSSLTVTYLLFVNDNMPKNVKENNFYDGE